MLYRPGRFCGQYPDVVTVNPSGPINNRHTIVRPARIHPRSTHMDFSCQSARWQQLYGTLGNTNIGARQADTSIPSMCHQTIVISLLSMITRWFPGSRTFQDAAQVQGPAFLILQLTVILICTSFEYISTSSLPGFAVSTVDTSAFCQIPGLTYSSVCVIIPGAPCSWSSQMLIA